MARFDRIAKYYDDWPLIDSQYKPLHAYFVRLVQEECARLTSERISFFEIGYGTGYTSTEVLGCDSRIRLVGADPSGKMRELAIQRLEKSGQIGRVDFQKGNALRVLPRITPVHIVGSVCTMHNIAPNERLPIRRCAFERLLPGGLYICGDKIAHDSVGEYLHYFDAQLRAIEGYRERGMHYAYRYWRNHEYEDHLNRVTESETMAMLREAGFVDVRVLERFGIYAVVIGRKPGVSIAK